MTEVRPPTLPATAPKPRLGLNLLGALGMVGLDLWVLGVGLLSILVGIGLTATHLTTRGSSARTRLLLAGPWALAAVGVAVFLVVNDRVARDHADRVAAAIIAYRSSHGQYPDQLEQLVPAHLPELPRARLIPPFHRFRYGKAPASPEPLLYYVWLPPFGRRVYDFEAKRWGGLD